MECERELEIKKVRGRGREGGRAAGRQGNRGEREERG